jgi:hypothetical protein
MAPISSEASFVLINSALVFLFIVVIVGLFSTCFLRVMRQSIVPRHSADSVRSESTSTFQASRLLPHKLLTTIEVPPNMHKGLPEPPREPQSTVRPDRRGLSRGPPALRDPSKPFEAGGAGSSRTVKFDPPRIGDHRKASQIIAFAEYADIQS